MDAQGWRRTIEEMDAAGPNPLLSTQTKGVAIDEAKTLERAAAYAIERLNASEVVPEIWAQMQAERLVHDGIAYDRQFAPPPPTPKEPA